MWYLHPNAFSITEAGTSSTINLRQTFAAHPTIFPPASKRDTPDWPQTISGEQAQNNVDGATECPSLSVHDGDTIRCGWERIRLADIDAPELPDSPKCEGYRAARSWCDFALGYQSRDALRDFLVTGNVEIVRQGEDRYGRTLAIVQVNGESAGQHLVALGLARQWE